MESTSRAVQVSILVAILVLNVNEAAPAEDGFESVCSWKAFDPGEGGVGNDPDGYHDAVFDGRFIYFIPYANGGYSYFGEVLRFDTTGDFADTSSWATFDPGAHGVGSRSEGFAGGVFDGRYVYFVPWADSAGYHGEVMRYDTLADFQSAGSWEAFDPGSHGVGTDADGYRGAAYDGRYVYFAPVYNGTAFHGEVLRYDTQGAFAQAVSWTTFDPGAHGVGIDPDGYGYPVYDGQYIYFSPYMNGPSYHGEVLRYDTGGSFTSAASWTTYDPGREGLGGDLDGYAGTIYDGRYIYFVPFNNGTIYHGQVLRYDTTGDFATLASWAVFDAVAQGIGKDPTGYCNAVYDNNCIYFVPFYNSSEDHGEVLRYDTSSPFSEAASWAAYEPHGDRVCERLGYRGGAFDGRYVYFVPAGVLYAAHGEVLRFDTIAQPGDLDGDSDADLADFAALQVHYGVEAGAGCADGDLDNDGDVDLDDYALFAPSLTGPHHVPGINRLVNYHTGRR